jgi:hypothetical protein
MVALDPVDRAADGPERCQSGRQDPESTEEELLRVVVLRVTMVS